MDGMGSCNLISNDGACVRLHVCACVCIPQYVCKCMQVCICAWWWMWKLPRSGDWGSLPSLSACCIHVCFTSVCPCRLLLYGEFRDTGPTCVCSCLQLACRYY